MSIEKFVLAEPIPENVFRSIVLFGRNVASYKFALAAALLDFAHRDIYNVPMIDLADPYVTAICDHLKASPKQGTSIQSKFLQECKKFNSGLITKDELLATTTRMGFQNVIDAFHRVGSDDVPTRFFIDNRKSSTPSILLTPEIFEVALKNRKSAIEENTARWNLVETAWELGTSTNVIRFDAETSTLFHPRRRTAITSTRGALNGYQKGKCFYCLTPIEIATGSANLADVDHVFPHVLQRKDLLSNLDGVWNLVLACKTCNRGSSGKFDSTPHPTYVERLHTRNEHLILSHHPLRETLIQQTGKNEKSRRSFLQVSLNVSTTYQPTAWLTQAKSSNPF